MFCLKLLYFCHYVHYRSARGRRYRRLNNCVLLHLFKFVLIAQKGFVLHGIYYTLLILIKYYLSRLPTFILDLFQHFLILIV